MASEEEIEENSMSLWKLIANYKEDFDTKITDLINSENIDINRSYGIRKTTPLYQASKSGIENIVKILLEKGAKIDSQDIRGYTPLFAAALNGHLNIVEILLEQGADTKIANNDGQKPFDIAMKMFNDTGDNKYSIISKRITDYHIKERSVERKESSESSPVENIFTNGSYEKETHDAIQTEKETPHAIQTEKKTPDAINDDDDGSIYNPLHKTTRKNVSYKDWLNASTYKTSRKGGKQRHQKTRRRRNKKSRKKRR
jgi:hypothetical protein